MNFGAGCSSFLYLSPSQSSFYISVSLTVSLFLSLSLFAFYRYCLSLLVSPPLSVSHLLRLFLLSVSYLLGLSPTMSPSLCIYLPLRLFLLCLPTAFSFSFLLCLLPFCLLPSLSLLISLLLCQPAALEISLFFCLPPFLSLLLCLSSLFSASVLHLGQNPSE